MVSYSYCTSVVSCTGLKIHLICFNSSFAAVTALALVEVPPATSVELLFNLVCSIVIGKPCLSFRTRELGGFFTEMLLAIALSNVLQ